MADTHKLITEIDTLVQVAERLARDAEFLKDSLDPNESKNCPQSLRVVGK
jgi:hypothetical protein